VQNRIDVLNGENTMATIKGCNLPDDLYYFIDKHVWAKPVEGGAIRIGITSVAAKLSGGKLIAITVKAKNIGQAIAQGKSVATLESSKFVGPVPAPLSGVLVRGNEKITGDPNIAVTDPYGEGWIAEMTPSNWDADKATLVTGTEGIAKYQAKLEAEGISCE
jgi:glycine cleavage system H protein